MTKEELRQIIADRSTELGRVQNVAIIDKYTEVIWRQYSAELEANDADVVEAIRVGLFK